MNGLLTWSILAYCSFFTTVRALDSEQHKCGASHGHRTRRHDHELFPRRPPSGNKYGYALYFETGQVIQYSKLRTPTTKFSVDFWMKPEGGQQNPAIVLHAYDRCAPENEARGWFIGLREAGLARDLRITFTVHSASSTTGKTIMSHSKVEPRRWYHVAATYDGYRMKLYVNQAKVAVGYGQKGLIFDTTACDLLEVGGDLRRGLYYRGEIDKLRLWNEAISHQAITQTLPENSIDSVLDKIVMYDDFNYKEVKSAIWVPVNYPRFVRSTVPEDKHDLSIKKPPCGKTICDNPEVIKSYLKHPKSRGSKHLRIRFINVMDDDGGRPMLKDSVIHSQFNVMQSAFSKYNITWEMEIKSIKNTWLRSKTVLHFFGCDVTTIGNSFCNPECNVEATGWDGGDCWKGADCSQADIGNGVCDQECNRDSFRYDGGDCCKTLASKTCIDPDSPNRKYIESIDDYKKAVGIPNRDALNVYVVNWSDEHLQGTAAFPWDKTLHTELGGVVLPPKNFATTKVLVHEIGHVLGLWHVHHGSHQEMDCSDDCFESFPSLELGDLCSDTNATIKHTSCSDPVVTDENPCGLSIYTHTPYNNYMSYANDSCIDHFTPQQVARMHCYIDLDYQSWQTNAKPSFVPLPPRIIQANNDRIKLSWLPPLGSGGINAVNLCNECDEELVLEQYATTAYSSIRTRNAYSSITAKDSPYHATGPPDSEHCKPSQKSAWKHPENVMACSDCQIYLEVGFKQAVVPNAIAIWVPFLDHESSTFADIVLIYTDGSRESIGNGTAQCDSPYTKQLNVKKMVASVRIYVPNQTVSIDAVKITSGIGHPNCTKCRPLHYIVRRDPPFKTGHETRVPTARFEDRNVDIKRRYEYKVRAVINENEEGPFSPPLIYEAKRGFCGNGKIDKGEDCDDGNVRDGDGCNIQCQKEDVFQCKGRPSLCYRHDGDGICEDFEKKTSIKDCGFFTPDGFKDQWADKAVSDPKYEFDCSPNLLIGPPKTDLKCESGGSALDAHYECKNGWTPLEKDGYDTKQFWLKVYFKTPAIASGVIVYLSTITPNIDGSQLHVIKFELHGSKPTEKSSFEHKLTKFCKENPVTIPVRHDMTKPFFKTRYIKMEFNNMVKIAAVALRSRKNFDLVGLQQCTGSQLFHPNTQKCQDFQCIMPKCAKLMLRHSKQLSSKCSKRGVEGDTCTEQCEKGFTPVAPFEVMCSDGKWLVDGEVPQCTPVDCKEPVISNAETYCPGGTTFGKKCKYKCKDGTTASKSGAELSITCEGDGMWSAITTFCRHSCQLPATPIYSTLISKNCHRGKSFLPGESCKYRCKTGYRPSGLYSKELYRKGDFVQRCLKDGTWTKKRCVRITCPINDVKISRWYNCTNKNFVGSVCKLACPGEKVREVQCGIEGDWDKKFQFCSTQGSCPPPVTSMTGDVMVRCGKNKRPGDVCDVTCGEGMTPLIQEGEKSKQVVNSIMCSPFLQWHPNPIQIKCETKCEPNYMDCDGIDSNGDLGSSADGSYSS